MIATSATSYEQIWKEVHEQLSPLVSQVYSYLVSQYLHASPGVLVGITGEGVAIDAESLFLAGFPLSASVDALTTIQRTWIEHRKPNGLYSLLPLLIIDTMRMDEDDRILNLSFILPTWVIRARLETGVRIGAMIIEASRENS